MLGSEVYGVVPDFAVLSHFPVGWGRVHMLGLIGVYRVAEALIDGYEASAGLLRRLIGGGGIMAS